MQFKDRVMCNTKAPMLKPTGEDDGCKVACHFPGEMKLFNSASSENSPYLVNA
jgi:hypothetical protein